LASTLGITPIIIDADGQHLQHVEEGDEVIIPDPGYPTYESVVRYAGGTPVFSHLREEDDFRNVIAETVKRGGKILMPVLGSGRAQDLIVILEEMIRTGQIEKIPVYIDGMVWDIMAIHTAYPEFLNSTMRNRIFHKDENPFLSDIFKIGSEGSRYRNSGWDKMLIGKPHVHNDSGRCN
jgi:Cft2 family RNA processing exonuclease